MNIRKAIFLTFLLPLLLTALDIKPIEFAEGYRHDRWITQPTDIVKKFRAYTLSFDSKDDDDGDDSADLRGQPEWVAYEIRKIDKLAKGPKRPSTWLTDKELFKNGVAPDDKTYKHSGYDRGHMCMKYLAWRLGANADWNTHTILNACPQIHRFNAGIWLDLEKKTGKWANKYGKVWVVCGPIFYKDKKDERKYIGDEGEMKIPIPDAFFKLVMRQDDGGKLPTVMAFLYPHEKIDKVAKKYSHEPYLVTVDKVEEVTGLDFLTVLDDEQEEALESVRADRVWDANSTGATQENFRKKIESDTPAHVDTMYWLNSSSNTRHNSNCRYYRKTKRGRDCKKNEGRPCGRCGG